MYQFKNDEWYSLEDDKRNMYIWHRAILSPEWNWACENWCDFNLQKNLIDDTIFLNY